MYALSVACKVTMQMSAPLPAEGSKVHKSRGRLQHSTITNRNRRHHWDLLDQRSQRTDGVTREHDARKVNKHLAVLEC